MFLFFVLIEHSRGHQIYARPGEWSRWTECSENRTNPMRCRMYIDQFAYHIPQCQPCRTSPTSTAWPNTPTTTTVDGRSSNWEEWGKCCPESQNKASRSRSRGCTQEEFMNLPTDQCFQTETCLLKWDGFELAPKKRKKRESIFDTLPLHFGDLWGGSSRDLSKINIQPSNQPLTRLSTKISPTGQIPTVSQTTDGPRIISTMQPDFENDFIEPSQEPVTRTTVAETTDYPKKAKDPVYFRFSNEFCRLENQMLNLEIFENVPEAFVYTEWSSWSNCNEKNGQRSRTRFCSFYEGSEKFCEENMLSEKSACSNSKYCFKPPAIYLQNAVELCLERNRCLPFRSWSDSRLNWLTNCLPAWGFSTFSQKTFQIRSKYIYLKAGLTRS